MKFKMASTTILNLLLLSNIMVTLPTFGSWRLPFCKIG